MLDKLSLLLPAAVFVLGTSLNACPPVETARDLPFRVVASGSHSPVGPGEFIYRDLEEWRQIQAQLRHVRHIAGGDEVVLLAAVDRNTGGHIVRFDSVTVTPAGISAFYTIDEPGPDCMVTQALTQPYQAIAVAGMPEGEVHFVQRREMYSC